MHLKSREHKWSKLGSKLDLCSYWGRRTKANQLASQNVQDNSYKTGNWVILVSRVQIQLFRGDSYVYRAKKLTRNTQAQLPATDILAMRHSLFFSSANSGHISFTVSIISHENIFCIILWTAAKNGLSITEAMHIPPCSCKTAFSQFPLLQQTLPVHRLQLQAITNLAFPEVHKHHFILLRNLFKC